MKDRGREAVAAVVDGADEASVDDLNSYERHLIHTLVRETEGMTSHSVGEGLRKNVIVTRAPDEADAPEDTQGAEDSED